MFLVCHFVIQIQLQVFARDFFFLDVIGRGGDEAGDGSPADTEADTIGVTAGDAESGCSD